MPSGVGDGSGGVQVASAPTSSQPTSPTCLPGLFCRAGNGYSPNVIYTLWYTFMDGACYSLWGMQLLPLFLQELTSRASVIGLVATVGGVAQLTGALIAGYVADRHSRQLCLRAGALCAAAALLTFCCAFGLASCKVVFAGQVLWGLYTGAVSTSVEALFADSVPQGRRATIYNIKWILQTLCYVVGYAAAAASFALWHNTWAYERMRAVLMGGVLVHLIALVPLCWLKDQHVVAEEREHAGACTGGADGQVAPATTSSAPLVCREHSAHADDDEKSQASEPLPDTVPQLPAALRHSGAGTSNGGEVRAFRLPSRRSWADLQHQQQQQQDDFFAEQLTQEGQAGLRATLWPTSTRCFAARLCTRAACLTSLAAVPYWMCAVDLLLSIGSGMSLPFFSLYFATSRSVSPAALYGIFIAATLLTALTSSMLPWLIASSRAGRIPAVIGVRLVGTAALFVLATAPRATVLDALPVTIGLFLCRNALMNSVFGVTRSVIMDCVARTSRAKWSAFESVTSLSWAGSAALGGVIKDAHGYETVFVITAAVQLTATLLMLPAAVGARELDTPLPVITAATVAEAEQEEEK